MFWITSFVISWIIFFILVDFKHIKRTIIGGVLTIIFQLYTDNMAIHYGLYKVENAGIKLFCSSVFFTFGAVLTIGIIFLQYLPRRNSWLKLANIFMWSGLFISFEILALYASGLRYIKWNLINSFSIDMAVFVILSWIGEIFVWKNSM